MQIEELNLEMRTYNAVKRAGITTVEELQSQLYLHDAIVKFGARSVISIEKALKKTGITQYARGDYITQDDILPEPLTWKQLHGMVGKLAALDISTESRTAYRVVWLFSFNDDDTRIIFQQDGNGYGNCRDIGNFYALKTTQDTVPEPVIVSAEYTRAVTITKSIIAHAQAMQASLWEVCKGLKEMRDGKLYKEIGYSTFEDYCEQEIGIKRRQGQKYIAIAEMGENAQSTAQIGAEKLYLLSRLDTDQRQEISETVDVESATVRELKAQIDKLKADAATQGKRLESAKKDAKQGWDEVQSRQAAIDDLKARLSERIDQINSLSEKIAEQAEQIDELESRPVEVAVPEPSHELQNMQDAMRRINLEHEEWSAKMQDDHIRHVQEINRQHRAETDALRAEYEEKLAAAQSAESPAPDEKEIFKAYLANAIDAAKRMTAFLAAHPNEACRKQAEKFFQAMMKEVQT